MGNIKIVGMNCTGCSACIFVCPRKCIEMKDNEEGFRYPFVDTASCVNCGVCLEFCPSFGEVRPEQTDTQVAAYIATSLNKKQRKKSASGGLFAAIAEAFIETYHGIVVGATLCSDNTVKHICIENSSDIEKLQNSKYVQSDTQMAYIQTLEYLKSGKHVLYSGTPCQINGIKNLTEGNDEYASRLFLIDLICHGVPSPRLFERYINETEAEFGKIKKLTFRTKGFLFKSSSQYFIIIIIIKGKLFPIIRSVPYDRYYKIFAERMGFRESCYKCQYANLNRVGDITIGDCDSRRLYEEFHPDEPASTLIINTERGKELLNTNKGILDYSPLNIEEEAKVNKQLTQPSERPVIRNEIYADMANMTRADVERYLDVKKSSAKSFFINILKLTVPYKLKRIIKRKR